MRNERGATKGGCDPERLGRIVPVDEGLRPGERHVVYNSRDVGGSLPEEYEAIIGRAAIWAGVGDQYLCGVVEQFERRIMRWQEDQKPEKEV
jgi:RNA polymerase I-specific transcription initiation factor RRN7